MGKGDKKTKKGKIRKGTYGNSRLKDGIKARMKRSAASAKNEDESQKPKKTVKKAAKKKVAKKKTKTDS